MDWTLKKIYFLSILLLGIILVFDIFYAFFHFLIYDAIVVILCLFIVTIEWFLAKRLSLLILIPLAVLIGYVVWVFGFVSMFGVFEINFFELIPYTPYSAYYLAALVLSGLFSSVGGWRNSQKKIKQTTLEQPISPLEQQVLKYLREHDQKIRISDCATEFNVSKDEIKIAFQSLERKGLLKTRSTNSDYRS